MNQPATLRIDHDSQPLDIILAVNQLLQPHGLAFKDDGKEYDGFVIYHLLSFATGQPARMEQYIKRFVVTDGVVEQLKCCRKT